MPTPDYGGTCGEVRIVPVHSGMTLRDWFAGLAMQAMIGSIPGHQIAPDAYDMADAMIKFRDAAS